MKGFFRQRKQNSKMIFYVKFLQKKLFIIKLRIAIQKLIQKHKYFGSQIFIQLQIYQQMEEKAVNNTELEKATSRRSRKDEEGRDFQCGCGKRYLSYPALYTHIKTKHDGRQPEGTLKTGTAQITKRSKGKLQQQAIKSICSYFHKQDLRIFSQLQDGLFGSVQLGSRIKKDNVPKETYDCYMSLIKQKQIKLQYNSTLDLALTVYLINVGFHVNDKIYDQFLSFARIARNCFSEHGEEIYRAYFSKKDFDGAFYLPSFSVHEVRYFPIVSDFIIQVYIPYTEQRDGKEINMSLMQLLVYDFCNWLYLHKLTMIKTSISKDFKLDYKPTIVKQKGTPNKADNFRQANSKENREENQEESEQLSQNEEINEDEEAEEGDKKPSGSKESNQLE